MIGIVSHIESKTWLDLRILHDLESESYVLESRTTNSFTILATALENDGNNSERLYTIVQRISQQIFMEIQAIEEQTLL